MNEAKIELRALIISGYALSALLLILLGYLSWRDDRNHRVSSNSAESAGAKSAAEPSTDASGKIDSP